MINSSYKVQLPNGNTLMKPKTSSYIYNQIDSSELINAQNALKSLRSKNLNIYSKEQNKRQSKPNLLINQRNFSFKSLLKDKYNVPLIYNQNINNQNNILYPNIQNGYKINNANIPKTSSTGRRPLMGMINFRNHYNNNNIAKINNKPNILYRNNDNNIRRTIISNPNDIIYNNPSYLNNNIKNSFNSNLNINNNIYRQPNVLLIDQNDERPLDKGEYLDKDKEKVNPNEGEERFECDSCGRKFVREALEKHRNVCQKVFNEKRSQFDSKKNRILDPEHAKILKKVENKEKKAKSKNKEIKSNSQPKWKKQSEEFRAIIKGGDDAQVLKPSILTEDYILCKFCNRKYNEQAYNKHLATCERKFKEAQFRNKVNRSKSQGVKKK